jgi:phenylalanyl-tRNA synthetase alpha chain
VGKLKSLEGDAYVALGEPQKREGLVLTPEGEGFAQAGSAEYRVFQAIGDGCKQADLDGKVGKDAKIGFAKGMSKKWMAIDKASGTITRLLPEVFDDVGEFLRALQRSGAIPAGSEKLADEMKKRKLIKPSNVTFFIAKKGSNFALERQKMATELTADMIKSGAWKNTALKPYNFLARGQAPDAGALHPLLKVRTQFREIFLEMGFEEMPTNKWVESSFWNFDTLFQPQAHPARDMHDTFFIKDPAVTEKIPPEFLQATKDIHEKGGFESIGYRYNWKESEARKNLLRTHTTAVSSRMLYQLAQEYKKDGKFTPKKFFSIDRVFRNETLDATHLAEFHQIEGVVCDRNITLGDLLGTIQLFFQKVLPDVELHFKPTYNPYTEPSMEVYNWHPGLGKLVEVGNSGVFRPEMLKPMGLPDDVGCIAWGLSLERPTMIKYGLDNVRDLFGYKMSLETVRNNPICRLDKD